MSSTNMARTVPALLVGVVAFSILLVFITGAGIESYKAEAVPFFIWTSVLGLISYWLWQSDPVQGAALAVLDGLLPVAFIGLVISQDFGYDFAAPMLIEVHLTISYALLGLVLLGGAMRELVAVPVED